MKYKVGDTVKIRKDLIVNGHYYNDEHTGVDYDSFAQGMKKYKGKIATITKCFSYDYKIDLDGGNYYWTDEMFEDVEEFKVGDRVKCIKGAEYCNNNLSEKAGTIDEILDELFTIKFDDNIDGWNKNGVVGRFWNVPKELVEKITDKEYTFNDFKKAPIGTKVTFNNNEIIIKANKMSLINCNRERTYENLFNFKDNWSDMGEIIKIEEPVEYKTVYEQKQEILDKVEKEYLSAVIKPFRNRIKSIYKTTICLEDKEYITIMLNDEDEEFIDFPYFEKDTMYKGMQKDKKYTLEELGV